MKKITTRVITITSQLLVSSVFLFIIFSSYVGDQNSVTISNNNFDKMADKTLFLFETQSLDNVKDDESVVTPLEDEETRRLKEEEEKKQLEEKLAKEEEEKKKKEEEERKKAANNVETKVPTKEVFADKAVINTYVGNLTSYGADCYGCSGYTSSGHNLNVSMYYDDSEYGTIRILAADPSFAMYSIFRVNVPGRDPFIGIVLDRGGNVGFGRGTLFDLAFKNESDPNLLPLTHNVTFELLRSGK